MEQRRYQGVTTIRICCEFDAKNLPISVVHRNARRYRCAAKTFRWCSVSSHLFVVFDLFKTFSGLKIGVTFGDDCGDSVHLASCISI